MAETTTGKTDVFYTCEDGAERINHRDAEEAVQEFIEGMMPSEWPLTMKVYAYQRSEIPDKEWTRLEEWLVEAAMEQIDEDYGDPDGLHDTLTKESQEAVEKAFANAVEVMRKHYVPWNCDRAPQHDVEVSVLEFLRDNWDMYKDDDGAEEALLRLQRGEVPAPTDPWGRLHESAKDVCDRLQAEEEERVAKGGRSSAIGIELTKPAKCFCGSEIPWHLVGIMDARFSHICSCRRVYLWLDKRTLKFDGFGRNPVAEYDEAHGTPENT